MAEISINAETVKIYSASLRVAILICDVEQAISATLMDSSEALTPNKKAGIVNSRLIEIRDSKDTRDSSFSAKSSRHFESRSSLHVSDLAALTISQHAYIIYK